MFIKIQDHIDALWRDKANWADFEVIWLAIAWQFLRGFLRIVLHYTGDAPAGFINEQNMVE